MRTQKATQNRRNRPNPMPAHVIDRSREEEIVLHNWAASDGQQIVDDLDIDDSAFEPLDMELADIRRSNTYLDG